MFESPRARHDDRSHRSDSVVFVYWGTKKRALPVIHKDGKNFLCLGAKIPSVMEPAFAFAKVRILVTGVNERIDADGRISDMAIDDGGDFLFFKGGF